MTRPSFSTTIRGGQTIRDIAGNVTRTATPYSRTASEVTSGVSRRKPKGWIPPTGYSFERNVQIYSSGKASLRVYQKSNNQLVGGYTVEGLMGGDGGGYSNFFGSDNNIHASALSGVQTTVPASMRDEALIKARLKMKTGDVNLGIAFAERNRTARLVADTAGQLTCSMRKLRRGDFRGAARCLGIGDPGRPRGGSVPRRWLELQYGWQPLLSDVYGSVDALTRQPRSNWIVTGTGIVRRKIDHGISYEIVGDGSPSGYVDATVKGSIGCFVRIDAVPENDLLMSLSSLGITNPLLVGWELVPFSFVVDWFLPIGSYLESLDAMLGYGESYHSISSFSKYRSTIRRSGADRDRPSGLRDETSIEAQPGWREHVKLVRTAGAGVPLPTMPRLRDGRSLKRMANALSLMAQVFAGR